MTPTDHRSTSKSYPEAERTSGADDDVMIWHDDVSEFSRKTHQHSRACHKPSQVLHFHRQSWTDRNQKAWRQCLHPLWAEDSLAIECHSLKIEKNVKTKWKCVEDVIWRTLRSLWAIWLSCKYWTAERIFMTILAASLSVYCPFSTILSNNSPPVTLFYITSDMHEIRDELSKLTVPWRGRGWRPSHKCLWGR